MSEFEEKKLIAAAQKGDLAAYEKLIKLHRDRLFSYTLSLTGGNYAAANDILQEALLKVFLYLKNFQGKSSFSTWLWRIIKNELINFNTSPRTTSYYQVEDIERFNKNSVDDTEEDVKKLEKENNLRKLISQLDPNHQEVITLVDLQEMKYEEAAELIGLSVSAVKSRLFRAREKLSELVIKNKKLFL